MKTKKYIVVAAIAVLVIAAAVALTGCASMQGAWAQIGINADKITSVTLVRSSGVASVLKPLEGQEMSDFIAAFDAIEVDASDDGFPDNDFEYAIRVTVDGKEGYCEYRIGAQVIAADGFTGIKHAYCYLSDEQYKALTDKITQLFFF